MSLKPNKPNLIINQLNQIHAQIIKTLQPQILNPFLKLLAKSSNPQNAFRLYNLMLHYPSSYNHYTFTHALNACTLAHNFPPKGLEIHAHVIKNGHFHDLFIQNALLHFYVTQHDVFSAHKVFDSINYPDVVSWSSLISGFSKCGFFNEAIDLFLDMTVRPNCITLVSVMSACCGLRSLKLGKAVHGYCLRNVDGFNIVWGNAMLDFYVRCGSILAAKYLFVKMPKRDVVSWSILIGGYAERGYCEEAIRVFQEMVKSKEAEPNEATIVNALSACSSISSLSLGQFVHGYINTKADLLVSIVVMNSLTNMYVKCGEIGMAIEVFNKIKYKDAISWSTIINGLALTGLAKQALQLFSLIHVNGIPPDGVTFIGVLSACSHGGLVAQGLMVFKAMWRIHKIVPKMEHCACIVDMFGRAGLLEEAEAVIREMCVDGQEKEEGLIWGALLNACRNHGNEEMFDRIKQEVENVRGVRVGTFALLSNTYVSFDRWDEANKVRDEMRVMGLKKKAGCSWIEVNPSIS